MILPIPNEQPRLPPNVQIKKTDKTKIAEWVAERDRSAGDAISICIAVTVRTHDDAVEEQIYLQCGIHEVEHILNGVGNTVQDMTHRMVIRYVRPAELKQP
jgi:hypothetical protein